MMAPMVATLEGVRAVNVAPLNCAGPNACDIVSVYTSVFWIAMVVLVIVGGLLVYAALRFRRTDDREPAQVHGNPRLEILWTAVPLVIVSFLFVRTTLRMDYVRNGPPPQQTIQVTGIQWAWSFKYPNGKTSITRLTIPVGQVVRLQVTSKDVLHSFWVPRLGGQIYAKPGYQNSGWIEASQPGQYLGQCNELCGINHFSMLLEVDAVSDADYQAFLSGAAPPGAAAEKVTGIQWAWSFKYPNGKTSITKLTIPVGQVVRLQVTSKDVLHSFWVPRLGGQIYAKPGYQNSGWIEASQPGQYLGQCNELCGLNHFSMLLEVDAVSDADYQAFLSGAAPPGAAAEKVTGVPAGVNVGETDALKFEPTTATAKIGDVIQWKNNGSLVHNVVFDNNQLPSSDPMNQGDTFEVKFTKPGTYSYVCKFHEASNMRGTITVTGG